MREVNNNSEFRLFCEEEQSVFVEMCISSYVALVGKGNGRVQTIMLLVESGSGRDLCRPIK